jgi:hypothetical protein
MEVVSRPFLVSFQCPIFSIWLSLASHRTFTSKFSILSPTPPHPYPYILLSRELEPLTTFGQDESTAQAAPSRAF